jgi:hypothetical protein
MITPKLDLPAGEAAKAAGVNQVIQNNAVWAAAVRGVMNQMPTGTEFTADDLRVRCYEAGVSNPAHQNGWGAFFRAAHQQGLIEWVGDTKATIKSSHARKLGRWRVA